MKEKSTVKQYMRDKEYIEGVGTGDIVCPATGRVVSLRIKPLDLPENVRGRIKTDFSEVMELEAVLKATYHGVEEDETIKMLQVLRQTYGAEKIASTFGVDCNIEFDKERSPHRTYLRNISFDVVAVKKSHVDDFVTAARTYDGLRSEEAAQEHLGKLHASLETEIRKYAAAARKLK